MDQAAVRIRKPATAAAPTVVRRLENLPDFDNHFTSAGAIDPKRNRYFQNAPPPTRREAQWTPRATAAS
jgi:uncharacterized membrane protein